jgi:hypothetical protein
MMDEPIQADAHGSVIDEGDVASRIKMPYQKPDFQCERVFETSAMACGKTGPTQTQCKSSRKAS